MRLIHRAMLLSASLIVPAALRREWLLEWTAELSYTRSREATAFCLGAFSDAACVRSLAAPWWRGLIAMSTPRACLGILMVQAAMAALAMWLSPAVQDCVWPRPVESHILIAAGALIFFPFLSGPRGFEARGLRGWAFMSAKLAVLLTIVYFASFDAVPLIARAPVQPQLAFVGYILAYRWAIRDQRRRCPTCLRRLTSPVRIGHSAGTLLEWFGAEYVCPEGHGVLHEPELIRSSYCSTKWVRFDASWRELFH
jgi:hypothetical protein